jgi:hypothetical protein
MRKLLARRHDICVLTLRRTCRACAANMVSFGSYFLPHA